MNCADLQRNCIYVIYTVCLYTVHTERGVSSKSSASRHNAFSVVYLLHPVAFPLHDGQGMSRPALPLIGSLWCSYPNPNQSHQPHQQTQQVF